MGSGPSATGNYVKIQTNGDKVWIKNLVSNTVGVRVFKCWKEDGFEKSQESVLNPGYTLAPSGNWVEEDITAECRDFVIDVEGDAKKRDGKVGGAKMGNLFHFEFRCGQNTEIYQFEYRKGETYYGYPAPVVSCKGFAGPYVQTLTVRLVPITGKGKNGTLNFNEKRKVGMTCSAGLEFGLKYTSELTSKVGKAASDGTKELSPDLRTVLALSYSEEAEQDFKFSLGPGEEGYIYQGEITGTLSSGETIGVKGFLRMADTRQDFEKTQTFGSIFDHPIEQ